VELALSEPGLLDEEPELLAVELPSGAAEQPDAAARAGSHELQACEAFPVELEQARYCVPPGGSPDEEQEAYCALRAEFPAAERARYYAPPAGFPDAVQEPYCALLVKLPGAALPRCFHAPADAAHCSVARPWHSDEEHYCSGAAGLPPCLPADFVRRTHRPRGTQPA
jgi:hypothetical protein